MLNLLARSDCRKALEGNVVDARIIDELFVKDAGLNGKTHRQNFDGSVKLVSNP